MKKSNENKAGRKTITQHYIKTLLVSSLFVMVVCVMLISKERDAYKTEVTNADAAVLANSTAAYYSYLISVLLQKDGPGVSAMRRYLNQIVIDERLASADFVNLGPDSEKLLNKCYSYKPDETAAANIPSCHFVENNQLYVVQEFTSGSRTIGYLVKSRQLSLIPRIKFIFQRPMLTAWMAFVVIFGIYYMFELHIHLVKPLTFLSRRADKLRIDEVKHYKLYEVNFLAQALVKAQHDIVNKSRLAAIGQSVTMIAHDIRKPFANMKALLDILPERRNDDMFVRQATAQVKDSVRRADAMMHDMLEYSRMMKVDKAAVGIQSVVSSAIGDVFKNAGPVDIAVDYIFYHKTRVYVDETGIARAATNIMENAVEAMRGNGHIWIETRDLDCAYEKQVEFTIANNGPMIPADDIDHLFEPFYTKGKKGGTGLGLAICQKIVTANGGKIEVRSIDERTEFIFTLPAGKGEEHIDESQLVHHSREIRDIMPIEPENRSLSEDIGIFMKLHQERGVKSYLLIVDDEPLFRETIRALINRIPEVRENLKVIEADSAEVALKQFEAREFDYVISDIEMGRRNMDGYEFANEVLDRYKNTFVMIHSNKRIHGKDENLMGRVRFQGFLPKPMDEGELMYFLAGKIFEQPGQHGGTVANITPDIHPDAPETKKLLVVNDEDFMRIALRCQLRKMGGVQVFEAGGMSDAMKIFDAHKIDIVLADINLGDINHDGYDVLRSAKERSTATKVYMMSGMQKEDEWPKAEASGADGYIQIPYEEEDLRKVVM